MRFKYSAFRKFYIFNISPAFVLIAYCWNSLINSATVVGAVRTRSLSINIDAFRLIESDQLETSSAAEVATWTGIPFFCCSLDLLKLENPVLRDPPQAAAVEIVVLHLQVRVVLLPGVAAWDPRTLASRDP